MLAFAILFLGICSRLVFHAPNFTPVIALALFGGFYLNKKYALLVPLVLMMLSDVLLGMHNIILFTWGSILFVTALGLWARKRKSFKTIFVTSILSAIVFFIVTNFGSWLVMGYPKTLEGFVQCYIAAIPFFRNTFFSTLVYSFVLFGLYELIALRVRGTKLASVLLTK